MSRPNCFEWQVGRAGRFGTKGLAITFVSSASDSDVLNQVACSPTNFFPRLIKLFFQLLILNYIIMVSGSSKV